MEDANFGNEVNRIKFLIEYDNSLVLNEQNLVHPKTTTDYRVGDDKANYKPKNIIYKSSVRPTSPVLTNKENIYQTGKPQQLLNNQEWVLPYKSDRAIKELCKDNDCKCRKKYGDKYIKVRCYGNDGKLKLQSVYKKDYKDYLTFNNKTRLDDIIESIGANEHGIIDVISVGLAILGGPVGILISAGIELGHALIWLKQGDKTNAALYAVFAISPIIGKIPAVKKLGSKGLEKLLSKLRNAENLTKKEKTALKEIVEKSDEVVASTLIRTLRILIKTKIRKLPLPKAIKFFVNALLLLTDKKFLINTGLTIGGVYLSYYVLSQIFGLNKKDSDTMTEEEFIEMVNNLPPQQLERVADSMNTHADEVDLINASTNAIEWVNSQE